MSLASSPPNGYISGRAARRLLNVASPYTIQALALRGEIRTAVNPGQHPFYCRADVERLAQARRQPERAGG